MVSGLHPTGIVLAAHEYNLLNRLNRRRYGGVSTRWLLPTRALGGTGPLAHCKIPANSDAWLRWLYV